MKTQMNLKKYTMMAVLFTLLSCTGYAQDGKTPTITKTFELNQPGSLNARSSGGGIDVFTHNQPKVEVQVFIRKYGKLLSPSDPQIKEILDDYDVNIEKDGNDIKATVERRNNFSVWKNVGISLTIIVPKEMSCRVSSSGGGVNVSGVSGTHHISSSGGGVKLENVSGTTDASSSGGGVHTTGLKGEARLSSSGGGVTVNDAKGDIYAHSSGGGVKLNNMHGDADVSSSGGGVTVTGECGYLKATSSGGSVHVELTKITKELHLKSSGGGVDAVIHGGDKLGLDLDLSSEKVNIELHNFSGTSEKGRIRGTMNNGGIPIYMHASGGNVNVHF